jgi:glutamine synthetase
MSINDTMSPQESLKNHNQPTVDGLVNGVEDEDATISQFKRLLASDTKVKVAGIDCDGILRGKIMNKSKFLSSLKGGFGMSSAIFGWDMHDLLYSEESNLTSAKTGYADFNAVVDLESMRRLAFEDNIPFFLLRFFLAEQSVVADGRGLVRSLTDSMAASGFQGLAGGKHTKQTVFLVNQEKRKIANGYS